MRPKRPLATWLLSYILVPALAVIVSCALREDTTVIRPNPIATATVELPSAAVGSPQSGRPNIVLITIDTLRADHLGSYGNPRVRTPNLDALAQQGARFDMAIAQFSQTNPSHASVLSGTYAATHKVKTHGVDKVSPSVTTLAEVLAGNGYTTAGIYSWPSFDPAMSGLERGFTTYRGVYAEAPGPHEQQDFWRKWTARADLTTDAALQWLNGNPSTPLFLWLNYQDPHYPYTSPPPFDTMYDPNCQDCPDGGWGTIDRIQAGERLSETDIGRMVAKYDGAISFTDREIGRLLEGLKQASLLDNAVVVVTADHGESFGDNGRWFHPLILYNSVLRVPLIIRYPPAVPQGLAIDPIVRSIDIMPTILELAGIPFSKQIEGSSLLPLILGRGEGDDRVALTQVPDDSTIALATREWKLIRNNVTGELELYNLRTDPGERNNLASANPRQASELEQKLEVWMEGHGISFWHR